ncbi:MAG: hypothetical protein ACE5RJ_02675 [Nitrosopumilaceae archaeon]
MKTLTVTAISVILATALILPAINSAQAVPQIRTVEDGRYQLSPKSFGPSTSLYMCDNGKCFNVDKTQKGSFDEIKKEELKSYKKAVALHEAYKFMKSYYKNHKTGLI